MLLLLRRLQGMERPAYVMLEKGKKMLSIHKPPAMIVYQKHPLNAGLALNHIREKFVTSQENFFVRTHGTIPDIDTESYRLSITGMVQYPLELSLDDLRNIFPVTIVTATLQCAGNRRDELMSFEPIPGEVPWGGEAISNAIWRGVRLQDVLSCVGIVGNARHVALQGLDEVQRNGERFGFGGSIPIEKALSSEVILAYEMNGEPLTPAHGFPLRAIVPGYIGARSVKWLAGITVQQHPSTNYFQAHAYKLFPPYVQQAAAVDWETAQMLGDLPLNSTICRPHEGELLAAGSIQVQGYAIVGGGQAIEQVEVSCDGGETWTRASILERHPWTWCFWECTVHLHPGSHQLVVRAWDTSGQTQPQDLSQVWNCKGYLNNAWHRVNVLTCPGA